MLIKTNDKFSNNRRLLGGSTDLKKPQPAKNQSSVQGFTLLEVLCALLISCILLSLCLRLLTDQWQGSKEIKDRLEIQYALLTAGETVSNAIRSAQTVQWTNQGVLKILPWPDGGVFTNDLYYIDDKDHDSIPDLYCEHLNVPNPVASRITNLSCAEVEPGLWQVTLQASLNRQQASWQGFVRRRS